MEKTRVCKNCIINRVCRGVLLEDNDPLQKLTALISELKYDYVVKNLDKLPDYVLNEKPIPLACDNNITIRRYGPEMDHPDIILTTEGCNYFVQTDKTKIALLSEQDLTLILDKELEYYKASQTNAAKDKVQEIKEIIKALDKVRSKIASTLPVALCGTGDLLDATEISRATFYRKAKILKGIKTKYTMIFPYYQAKEIVTKKNN